MNFVTETDRSTLHSVFYVGLHYAAQKSWSRYYNFMNTLNTSSGAYTAIFHSLSAYDARSWPFMTSFYVGILYKCYTVRSLSTVKCHSNLTAYRGGFGVIEGFCHTLDTTVLCASASLRDVMAIYECDLIWFDLIWFDSLIDLMCDQ